MTDRAPPHDHRRELTDKIIKLLEDGTAPWQQPWTSRGTMRLPMNPTTGKPYHGGNCIGLMIAGMEHGFADPRWATYRQAAEKGWQVRKGEKGSRIEFWDRLPLKADAESGDEQPSRWFCHIYTVFNAVQIDGIPQIETKTWQPWEVIEAGENILTNSGADIRYGGNRAFYQRNDDFIRLPNKSDFPDAAAFYGVACHELAHWSGHPSRLNRATLTDSKSGDELYAFEELIADLSSCFMAADRGIPYDPQQTAAYVAAWIKVLKDDKNAIFRAAHDASAATDFVLGRRGTRLPQQVSGSAPSHVDRLHCRPPAHLPGRRR